ncbi:MAG: VacJ family lipoprotein [Candidatus Paracaedimonas acanthamoebae]|uniref:VacJ family lipoprotein n=1 Tax=Candidatus Paracaedimonas acanthamoebae TaxID=244581 RepID=A0A8J7PM70_9PROT|nr:VacJ family lipoprotein [Candidatus Paracaedimonas acanthamoebae]
MSHKLNLFIAKYTFFALLLGINLLFSSYSHGSGSYLSDADILESIDETVMMNDPLEDLNRSVFNFNQYFDKYIFSPVAEVYDEGLPDEIKDRVHSVLINLTTPLVFIHDVFQAEGEQAVDSCARFLINSTLGLGGLFDPAAEVFDIQSHTSDFGQTLGKYGVDEGAYLMIPILGPSTVRDFTGRVLDFIIDPVNYLARRKHASAVIYTRTGLTAIDARVNANALWKRVNNGHDPYITLQSIYGQNRKFMIQGDTAIGLDSPRPSAE